MSEVLICGECGQLKPRQRVTCAKHDFTHDPEKHCDHCENDLAAQLEREWNEGVEKRNAEREAKLNAQAKAGADAKAKADADAKDGNSGT